MITCVRLRDRARLVELWDGVETWRWYEGRLLLYRTSDDIQPCVEYNCDVVECVYGEVSLGFIAPQEERPKADNSGHGLYEAHDRAMTRHD